MKNLKNWKIFLLPVLILVVLAAVVFSKTSLQKGVFYFSQKISAPTFKSFTDLQPIELSRSSSRDRVMIVKIKNSGTRASGSFHICGTFYSTRTDRNNRAITESAQRVSVDALNAHEERTINLLFPTSISDSSARYISVKVDCTSLIAESNEDNNNIRFDF